MIEIPSLPQNFSELMPIYVYFIALYNVHLHVCRKIHHWKRALSKWCSKIEPTFAVMVNIFPQTVSNMLEYACKKECELFYQHVEDFKLKLGVHEYVDKAVW